jgi:hypothetical protein
MAGRVTEVGSGGNNAPLSYRDFSWAAKVIDLKNQPVNLGHVKARVGIGKGIEGDFVVAG